MGSSDASISHLDGCSNAISNYLSDACCRKQILEWAFARLLWPTSRNIFQIYDRVSREGRWFPSKEMAEGMDKAYK